jgi:hypothetical protein
MLIFIAITLNLSFVIYDQSGRLLKEIPVNSYYKGSISLSIILSGFDNGVYYLLIKNGDSSISNRKVVLMR